MTGANYSYHQLINQAELKAGKNINIAGKGKKAKKGINNAVILNSADINAGGNVNIDSIAGDVSLEASQVAFMDGSKNTTTDRKWFGLKKKQTTTTKKQGNQNAITTDINAKNIKLKADGNIKIYGSELEARKNGDVDIEAGKGLYLYAITNKKLNATDVKKKASFLGIRYNKDHTNDTRLELSQLPTKLIGGKAYTKSGHDTVLQGTVFDTLDKDDIQVGVGKYANNEDNEDRAVLLIEPIIDTVETTHKQERDSLVWMKSVNKGKVTRTMKLPTFTQTPSISSAGGVTVKIPVDVTIKDNQQAKKRILSQGELGKIAIELSKQPGYEYLADLDKRNDINWKQVELIQENWDYTQEGLTPAAAALIAIAVTMATGGSGAGVGASLASSVGVTSAAGLTAANAAFASLASQASVTLINNKGNINQTLTDLATSETVRNIATAALTAGLGEKLNIPQTGSDFGDKLAQGVANGVTNAIVDATVNGTDLEQALKNSLRNALVDAVAAQTFTDVVKPIDAEDFASNLAHKLVASGVGCLSAKAKKQSCDAGALGAAVGEMVGDYLVTPEVQKKLNANSDPKLKAEILNTAKLVAASVALVADVDVNTAADSAEISVKNNNIIMAAEMVVVLALFGLVAVAVKVPKHKESDTARALKKMDNHFSRGASNITRYVKETIGSSNVYVTPIATLEPGKGVLINPAESFVDSRLPGFKLDMSDINDMLITNPIHNNNGVTILVNPKHTTSWKDYVVFNHKLEAQLYGEQIANGHAYDKHVVEGKEFIDYGIDSKEKFANLIEDIILNTDDVRYTSDGRAVYVDHERKTVVWTNPDAEGTAFRPRDWNGYINSSDVPKSHIKP